MEVRCRRYVAMEGDGGIESGTGIESNARSNGRQHGEVNGMNAQDIF
jgi:hypothetical protein